MSVISQQVARPQTTNPCRPAQGLKVQVRGFAGNHTMMMKPSASETVARQADEAHRPLSEGNQELLQRKCACGGSGGLTGTCSDCEKKKLLGKPLQTKLRVNEAGDEYEQEADRVVTQVLATSAHHIGNGTLPLIHHYTDQVPGGQADMAAPSSVERVVRGAGRPLEPALRQDMEQRFGCDFSEVRVHSSTAADQSAREVNAQAYTTGNNIVFGRGRFSPGTYEGRRLIAHELAHVVQQHGEGGLVSQAARQVVFRVPTKEGIEARPFSRYSYSTNCGWIDWGHALGGSLGANTGQSPGNQSTAAGDLIQNVRSKSAELRRESKARAVVPGTPILELGKPSLAQGPDCPTEYDAGEVAASKRPEGLLTFPTLGTKHVTHFLFGFEIGKSDASRFASIVDGIGRVLESDPSLTVEIWGFTDCMGGERNNLGLRIDRAIAVRKLLPSSFVNQKVPVTTFAPMDRAIASNATPEGRRMNRAVAIKIMQPLEPRTVVTSQSSKKRLTKFGVSAGQITVHDVMLGAQILRPLSSDEELSVALGIFQMVSEAFETAQMGTNAVARSAFSEEDLPSNTLGFYAAARGLTRADLEKACDAWDTSRSLARLQGYQFHDEFTHKATRLPPGGSWPTKFDDIKPAKPGNLWKMQFMQILEAGKVTNIP